MMRIVVVISQMFLRPGVIVMELLGLPAEVVRRQPLRGQARGISNNFKVVPFYFVV